ncbi:MAG: DinB family protein [Treponema sp.]|nr:DinB family protein [Treponema sp.]
MEHFPVETYLKQVTGFYELLAGLEDIADIHTDADTWTIRNHVAHLIDSASNNHQRFVRLQLSPSIVFPSYEAEPWVDTSRIRQMDFRQLILLWKLYNEYLLEIIRTIPEDCLMHTWQPENGRSPLTLEFLVQDYYVHMKIHEKMIGEIAAVCSR